MKASDWRIEPYSSPGKINVLGRVVPLHPIHKMGTYRPTNLVQVTDDKGTVHVVAFDTAMNRASRLNPTYDVTVRRGRQRFRIWLATSKQEVDRALFLIGNEHPDTPRRRGTFICMAEITGNPKDALVGAAILDGLTHGNPIERDILARPVFGDDWLQRWRDGRLSRGAIVHQLGLVCGTRFAIRKDNQGTGLGDMLASHTAVVAACWRWPPADTIEVVRWMPGDKLLEIVQGRPDFLTRAGYTALPSYHWTNGETYVPDRIPIEVTVRRVPAWYYRRIASLRSQDPIIRDAIGAIEKLRKGGE